MTIVQLVTTVSTEEVWGEDGERIGVELFSVEVERLKSPFSGTSVETEERERGVSVFVCE